MLTDAQRLDVRRYAGYPLVAADPSFTDPAIIRVPGAIRSLAYWLDNLSDEEETRLVDIYLTNLATLETGILSFTESIDTAEAGPWKANPKELSDRRSIYNMWRRDMCDFIGVAYGPGLSGGGNIVRS